jgi:outer membrane lipoprotein-sorting protein
MQAIGADRFPSITTFVERGDLDGNLTTFWQGSRSTAQAGNRGHGTFEFYFKSPNLRFTSTVTEKGQVIALQGCNGKINWYINQFLKRTESNPKPGSEGNCEMGFQSIPSYLRAPNIKMRLLKKKNIEGRMAWEIKVDAPQSPVTAAYYFDAETFLLLRQEMGSKTTYSDYRDVGGIKLPFTTTIELTNSKIVTTIREVKINEPVEDARFVEPKIEGGKIAINSIDSANKTASSDSKIAPPAPSTTIIETPKTSAPATMTTGTSAIVEVNFPNFASCTIAELQLAVPELKGLKPANGQEKLAVLLDQVGAKTLDIARNTPDLISSETVILSQQGVPERRRDYDYLIVARVEGKAVQLDEFRVDIKSGDKFQTDEILAKGSSTLAELERASQETAASEARPPATQGFATSWVHFYPLNRPRAEFRYLGEQKMDGRHTLVIAFAQKPAAVLTPATFRYHGQLIPFYLQGVAWVDSADFRILRLQTNLLSPLPEVSLHRLTADIQFALTRIESVPVPLSLPREITVTSTVGESTLREVHQYSGYRLFRAHSKIVLNP